MESSASPAIPFRSVSSVRIRLPRLAIRATVPALPVSKNHMHWNTALGDSAVHSKRNLWQPLPTSLYWPELLEHCNCLWLATNDKLRFRMHKPLHQPGSENPQGYPMECWQQLSPRLRSRHRRIPTDDALRRNSTISPINQPSIYSHAIKSCGILPRLKLAGFLVP